MGIMRIKADDVLIPPGRAVGSTSESRTRGPGFDTRSGNILSFLLPLIQERQLSVTGEVYARSTG